jgi:putative flippase GtrA
MKRLSDAPLITVILGFGGLIPFVAGAVGLGLGGQAELQAANALPVYAAVILSFLAGGRWTSELVIRSDAPRPGVLILAISLALAGWIAVPLQVWSQPGLTLNLELVGWCVLIAGFLIQYLWDRAAIRDAILPEWYLPLRSLLTVGAVLSLSAAAFIRWSPTFSL